MSAVVATTSPAPRVVLVAKLPMCASCTSRVVVGVTAICVCGCCGSSLLGGELGCVSAGVVGGAGFILRAGGVATCAYVGLCGEFPASDGASCVLGGLVGGSSLCLGGVVSSCWS
jgi:hypothetical protein